MKKKTIQDGIHYIEFDNQLAVTSTLLRFQEHYECPNFAGRIFSLDEFKKWYTEDRGSFSYHTDWNGFNFPSHILKPFKEGKFDPLSKEEQAVLDMLEQHEGKFYVIATHKEASTKTFDHEIAHALFYLHEDYRTEVLNILSKYDTVGLREELKEMGYAQHVMDDEVHAYALSGSKKISYRFPLEMKQQLETLFRKFANPKRANYFAAHDS